MFKYHDYAHHHAPAGLHHLATHVKQLLTMGYSEDDIRKVITPVKDQLSKCVADRLDIDAVEACSLAIAALADKANREVIEVLRNSTVLIAGEFRPHLIAEMLNEGLSVVQVHDRTPHGHPPPHFRDLVWYYPTQFRGVLSLPETKDVEVTAIVIDAFLDKQDIAHVSPLAMIACRIWPQARVVALLSDHRAPHHIDRLGRGIDQVLFWE